MELTFKWDIQWTKWANYKVHSMLESEVLCKKNETTNYKIKTGSYQKVVLIYSFSKWTFRLLLWPSGIAHYFLYFFLGSIKIKEEIEDEILQSDTSVQSGRF